MGNEPEFRKIEGDGIEIQLARWAGKEGNILCIHGLTANCRCWDRIAHGLSPQWQVFAMDLRGRGYSAKPETGYSIEHHCRDIEALISGLQLDRVTVVGHSLGASIAAYFAATRPGRTEKTVLIDGGGQLSEEQMEKVVAGIRISLERLGKVFPDYESYVENLRKAPFFKQWNDYLDAYFRYEIEEAGGGVRSRVYPEGIQEELGNMRTMQMADYYKDISSPVLILRATEGMMGPDDLLLPEDAAEKMEKEIASARLLNIAGTNHYTLIFEENETRDRAIQAFLSSV